MSMGERIKMLRKNYLNLTQTSFGNHLGVSRSVINNIERDCLARPEQKLSLIKLMCKEFNVNENWVLNGVTPIFNNEKEFSLDKFFLDNSATRLEIEIIKIYISLDKQIRDSIISKFKEVVKAELNESIISKSQNN